MTPRMCGAGLACRRRGSGELGRHRGSTGRGIACPRKRESKRGTPRVGTRRAGLAPRPEYEVGTGCRLCGEAAPLREHEQAAVEALAQLDTAADDAPLGLGGPRGDKADAEVAQDAP